MFPYSLWLSAVYAYTSYAIKLPHNVKNEQIILWLQIENNITMMILITFTTTLYSFTYQYCNGVIYAFPILELFSIFTYTHIYMTCISVYTFSLDLCISPLRYPLSQIDQNAIWSCFIAFWCIVNSIIELHLVLFPLWHDEVFKIHQMSQICIKIWIKCASQ